MSFKDEQILIDFAGSWSGLLTILSKILQWSFFRDFELVSNFFETAILAREKVQALFGEELL